MVREYVAKYGGTASGVNADIAEAYSVGQVLTQAVKATHGFNQQKIIKYLKSGVTLNSVQGPVKFDNLGENLAQKTLTFQWQNGKLVQVIPTEDRRRRSRRSTRSRPGSKRRCRAPPSSKR